MHVGRFVWEELPKFLWFHYIAAWGGIEWEMHKKINMPNLVSLS